MVTYVAVHSTHEQRQPASAARDSMQADSQTPTQTDVLSANINSMYK